MSVTPQPERDESAEGDDRLESAAEAYREWKARPRLEPEEVERDLLDLEAWIEDD